MAGNHRFGHVLYVTTHRTNEDDCLTAQQHPSAAKNVAQAASYREGDGSTDRPTTRDPSNVVGISQSHANLLKDLSWHKKCCCDGRYVSQAHELKVLVDHSDIQMFRVATYKHSQDRGPRDLGAFLRFGIFDIRNYCFLLLPVR